jgi:hypothetical protein
MYIVAQYHTTMYLAGRSNVAQSHIAMPRHAQAWGYCGISSTE